MQAARPRIVNGRVELFCAPCWVRRDEPIVVPFHATVVAIEATVRAPSTTKRNRMVIAGAALAVGIASVGIATRHTTSAAAALPAIEVRSDDSLLGDVQAKVADDAPPDELGARRDKDPSVIGRTPDGERLDERFPSLKTWLHPVTDSDELVPVRSARKFGAVRFGIDRDECGGGHCGLDLAGPRGRPVVAVAWGTVVRVEHSESGRDGKSGRYVRIEHPDGAFTAYMHLDAIAPGLEVGDEVEQGRVIGTLGKSAIYHGEEHLHFGLEITISGSIRFIDPTPFLLRAKVVPIPARAAAAIAPGARPQW